MTDDAITDVTPDDERIELASAYLDGEVTASERARVLGDPGLIALVDELAAVRARLGAHTAVDPARRDEHLAAALELYTAGRDVPTSLTVTRARRARPLWVRLAPVGAVAAVVVAAIGLAIVLRPGDDDGGDVTAAGDGTDQAETVQTTAAPEALAAPASDGTESGDVAAETTDDAAAAAAAGAGEEAEQFSTAAPDTTLAAGQSATTAVELAPPATGESQADQGPADSDTTAATVPATTAATTETGAVTRSRGADHPCEQQLQEERPDLGLGALQSVQAPAADGTQRLGYVLADGSGEIALVIDPDTCDVVTTD